MQVAKLRRCDGGNDENPINLISTEHRSIDMLVGPNWDFEHRIENDLPRLLAGPGTRKGIHMKIGVGNFDAIGGGKLQGLFHFPHIVEISNQEQSLQKRLAVAH